MADPRRTFQRIDHDPPTIVVARDGREWCAAIDGRSYQSPFLVRVDRWVRRTLDLTDRAWVNYEFRTGDPHIDKLVGDARQTRLAAYLADAQAQEAARVVLLDHYSRALSQREVGVLLCLSHQRIHQLRAEMERADPPGAVDR